MLYIKEGIQYNEITNLAGSEVESVWANIQCDKQQLALGIIRPAKSPGISGSLQKWGVISRSPGIVKKTPGTEGI